MGKKLEQLEPNMIFQRTKKQNTKILFVFLLILIFVSTNFFSTNSISIFADTIPESIYFGETVDVGLRYSSNAVSSFDLYSESGFLIGEIEGEYLLQRQTIYAQSITIKAISDNGTNSVIIIDTKTGDLLSNNLTSQNCIIPMYYTSGYFLKLENTPYRGGIKVTQNQNATLNIINHINIDEYVYGVLNAELNYSNPIEALKAQAIAARSFAKVARAEGGRHKSYGFDVCASTHCQVYRGKNAEEDKTNEAVDATKGLCIYHEGEPVMAYYHKNSGGYTQDVEDVWGKSQGYLLAVSDPYTPKYYWEKTYTFADIENILLSKGNDIGSLQRISIAERNENGLVSKLTFFGTKGEHSYKNEQINTFFGYSNIKSLNFAFSGELISEKIENQYLDEVKNPNMAGDTQNQVTNSIQITNGNAQRLLTSEIYVLGNEDTTIQKAQKSIFVYDGNQIQECILNNMSDSSEIEDQTIEEKYIYRINGGLEETSGIVKFTGLGYGHGIGMPQDSAVEMANQGFTFEDILLYYYTDIQIR